MQLTGIQGTDNKYFVQPLMQPAKRHKKLKGSIVSDMEIKSRLHTGRQSTERLKRRWSGRYRKRGQSPT
jgi:hypothetical protein